MKLSLGVGLLFSLLLAVTVSAQSKHELHPFVHLFDYDPHASPEEADLLLRSSNPQLLALRASLPKGQLETYLKTLQDLNAINYVRHARVPLLLQFANFEQYFDRTSMDHYQRRRLNPRPFYFTIPHTI